MKKLIFLITSLALCSQVFSQTVVVTDNASYTTGNASSVLDVNSVLKGFLAPRMTQAQRVAITSPADGLLVYQTDATKGFYYYNGTSAVWTLLSTSSGTFWSLTGNAGTNSSGNYLGTTDNVSLKMRTNATQRVLVDSLGNVGIGTSPSFTAGTPREKFLVDAGSSANPTTSYNVISGKGYINNYLQLNIQNTAATANASSDVVASNDAATQIVNFVDMGINSSGNTSTGVLGGASTAYLYGTGNDFAIGNGTANKNLLFFTGGTATNERMRIDGSGNVGIGTSAFNSTYPEKVLIDAGDNGSNPITALSATGTTNDYLQLNIQNKSSGHNASSDLVVTADGTRNGSVPVGTDNYYVDFGINSSGYLPANSNILNHTSTPYLYTSSPNDFYLGNAYTGKDLVFFTNYGSLNTNNSADGTEVMRITGGTNTSTQQVAIGTAAPNGTNKLTVNGSISASAFNVSSDRRLKTNINWLHYGLKDIMALKPVSYNWKDPKQAPTLQIGLIAQDTKNVIPEVVSGDEKKGMLSINYTELVPVLIKAIQEQQKEIDELKKVVQKLQK